MKTEQEARQTRCCGPEGCGKIAPQAEGGPWPPMWPRFCIASECMAWRWNELVTAHEPISDKTPGYCGLAGKP